MMSKKTYFLSLGLVLVGFATWTLMIQADGAKSKRCQASRPQQILCDPSILQNSNDLHQIRLNAVDSKDLLLIVKALGEEDIIQNGNNLIKSYRLISQNAGIAFICVTKNIDRNNTTTGCVTYYSHNKKDPSVQILENENFVNIRFKDESFNRRIKAIFQQYQASSFVSKEKVDVRINGSPQLFSRFSLLCNDKLCEVRGVPTIRAAAPAVNEDDGRPYIEG